jgi:hypothetical protein
MVVIFGYGVQFLPREWLLGLLQFLSAHSYLEIEAITVGALIVVDAATTLLSLRGFRRSRLVF